MKEIIYLDTDVINSLLAQLNEGLIQSYSEEVNSAYTNNESHQSGTTSSSSVSGNIKINTGLLPGGGLALVGTKTSGDNNSEMVGSSILEGQKDILNKAFHDYSLNVLIDSLKKEGLLSSEGNYKDGEIYEIESSIKMYDFDLIRRASDTSIIKDFFFVSENKVAMTIEEANEIIRSKSKVAEDLARARQVIAAKKEAEKNAHNYKKSEALAIVGSNLLKDNIVVKCENIIALAKENYFKTSTTTFAIGQSERKVKIIFRVINKRTQVYNNETVAQVTDDHFGKLPSVMLDIILVSLNILSSNDYLVTPIAIYYEKN